jgi:hypothetical protein
MNRSALQPSHNGAYLIDLVDAFNLTIANTFINFFKHRLGHLAIQRHEATKRWYVKDYILVFGSAMRGVIDCRMYVSVQHRLTDHHLLVLLLQFSLKAQQHVAPGGGLWDGEALYVLEVKVAFEGATSNRFSTLNLEVSDLEDEWQKWVHNISMVALEKVGMRKMQR